MTTEERNKKIEKFLKENNLSWHTIHNWVCDKGYVIVTTEEYDNLEVIDSEGAIP